MRTVRSKLLLACSTLVFSVVSLQASGQTLNRVNQEITDYSPVTKERLVEADPSDWLLPKGNYEGWMYSELDQINRENVQQLRPVWT